MGYIQRITLACNVTVSGGGAQSFRTSNLPNGGYLEAITYTKALTSGFSTAGHVQVLCDQSSQIMLNVTTTGTSGVAVSYYPRAAAQDSSGVIYGPATGAGAVVGFPTRYPIGQEAIRIVASSGGTASNGGVGFTMNFYVSGV